MAQWSGILCHYQSLQARLDVSGDSADDFNLFHCFSVSRQCCNPGYCTAYVNVYCIFSSLFHFLDNLKYTILYLSDPILYLHILLTSYYTRHPCLLYVVVWYTHRRPIVRTEQICCPKCHFLSIQNHKFRSKFRPNFKFLSRCSVAVERNRYLICKRKDFQSV